MKEAPFFTIGVPVYNAEKYLPMCLDSILGQSFSDFELILVNDGSTDNSLEICRAYQKQDSRIILIDQKNGGVSAASNRILDNVSGKYIYLMDNDDEMYEGILQKAHDYLVAEEVDILHGGYYVKTPGGEFKLRLFRNNDIQTGFAALYDFLVYEANVGFSKSMWTKFVRAEFWKKSEVRFQSKYNGCQDLDVSRRLMCSSKTVRYVDDIILIWYHPREGSISTEWSFSMMRNYWRFISDLLCEALPALPEKERELYEKKNIQDNGHQLWRLTSYTKEQQTEIGNIIAPIRNCFKSEYADDKRTAVLFFAIRYFGARTTAVIIKTMRKLKHIVLGR